MRALYPPALNGRKASDWLRPVICQWGSDKLPKGPYQSSNGYSTRVHLPGHLACDLSSQREASHISSQGKEPYLSHMTYIQSSIAGSQTPQPKLEFPAASTKHLMGFLHCSVTSTIGIHPLKQTGNNFYI